MTRTSDGTSRPLSASSAAWSSCRVKGRFVSVASFTLSGIDLGSGSTCLVRRTFSSAGRLTPQGTGSSDVWKFRRTWVNRARRTYVPRLSSKVVGQGSRHSWQWSASCRRRIPSASVSMPQSMCGTGTPARGSGCSKRFGSLGGRVSGMRNGRVLRPTRRSRSRRGGTRLDVCTAGTRSSGTARLDGANSDSKASTDSLGARLDPSKTYARTRRRPSSGGQSSAKGEPLAR